MRIHIAADTTKLAQRFASIEAKVQMAIAQGLNEGGDKVRTQVRRAMREQTSLLRLSSVTSRERNIRAFGGAPKSGVGPVGPGSLSYTIVYSGRPPTRPNEFKTTSKRGPGGGVTIVMWQKAHKFQRSFKSASKGLLRARLGGPRFPIRGFDGPNLAKEAARETGQVAMTFLIQSRTLVPPMIEKRLARLLG